MSTTNTHYTNPAHPAQELQPTQTTKQQNIEFVVEDGVHRNEHGEYEVWIANETYGGPFFDYQSAFEHYIYTLQLRREHRQRNEANAEAEREEEPRSILVTANGETQVLEIEEKQQTIFDILTSLIETGGITAAPRKEQVIRSSSGKPSGRRSARPNALTARQSPGHQSKPGQKCLGQSHRPSRTCSSRTRLCGSR